jgi:hypothetical protein
VLSRGALWRVTRRCPTGVLEAAIDGARCRVDGGVPSEQVADGRISGYLFGPSVSSVVDGENPGSGNGNRFVEVMLTVIETCWQRCQQGRNVVPFLSHPREAYLAHQPFPWDVKGYSARWVRRTRTRDSKTLPGDGPQISNSVPSVSKN